MDSMDGYVFLNHKEADEAEKFYREYEGEIPDMDEGVNVAGSPIIYGLVEDPETGRLAIPKQLPNDSLVNIAKQVACLTDREWKIWEMRANGCSQRRIASKLGMTQRGIGKLLQRVDLKIDEAGRKMRGEARTAIETASITISAA